jgi:hypothetical protein
MKYLGIALLICLVVCMVTIALRSPLPVQAQSYGALSIGTIAPALSNCPAGAVNAWTLCGVGTSPSNYAMYISWNGGAYALLVAPSGGAVTSVFGRTGAVVATAGDYTTAQVGADASGTATAAATAAQTAAQTFATNAVNTEAAARQAADALLVPKTTTVNNKPLSGNITITATTASQTTLQ